MTRVKQALNRIRDEIEGQTVLEVACGCAEFSIAASEIAKKVNCIDIDLFRLDEEISAYSNVAFDLMDATDMKYEDNAFDTVVIYNAIAHLDTVFPSFMLFPFCAIYLTLSIHLVCQPFCLSKTTRLASGFR